ncbi:MAG: isomerizing glutamine--fructose-6-phosphate transaminase, partial [Chloracidobacterium sp.]|nr:isomerizing glutamine--fructose-6-phosphate transaminase [Chloracidobacterium sp.]
MCGIIGYVGDQQAVPVVLEGLRRLEYRGYDSAGIAVINGGKIEVRRRPGKLQGLLKAIEDEPLEGQTGLGHCLSPDTLIQLADGRILPIGEAPNEIEVLSLDLATMRLTPHPAFVFRHQAPENMLEIRAASTGITCTREHRMLIVNPKTGGIEERLARDIKIGDLLLLAKRIPAPPDAQTMSFATTQPRRYWSLSDIGTETLRNTVTASGLNKTELARRAGITDSALRHILVNDRHAREDFLKCICRELDLPFPPNGAAPIHSHHGNFVNLPERATPELMRLVGYFIGDGHAHEHCLRWKDQRRDVLEHYQKIAASLFGLEGRIVHLPDVEAWLLEINSLEMARWFREHFVENREDLFARLGQQSDELIAAFLRGLFDAEGSVACAAGQVSLRMNNILLIRRVQQWLLRFGIITSFYIFPPAPTQKRPNAYAGVFISDAYSMRLFAQVIGFSSTDKLGKLQTVLEGKCADRTRTIKAIPLSAGSLRSWLGKLRVPVSKLQFLRGRDSLSEYRARKLVEELANYPQAQIVRTLLQSYLDGDVFLQKVIIIRDIRNTTPYVYDLEVPDAENFIANGAISHNSRWASHGRPTEENAHPHRDCFGRIVVVHNGIIENYLDLKRELQSQDHIFQTETDTEVVAHLIEKHLSQDPAGGLEAAFRRALAELRGIYALVAMSADEPEKIVAARLGPPIVVGLGDGECFVASDIPALLPYTRDIFYLGDRETVTLTREGARVRDGNGVEIKPQVQRINWDPIQAEKGGFKHFMLKEIYEQPRAIRDTTQGRVSLDTGRVFLDTMAIDRTDFGRFTDIKIAACGTAWHAAMVAKYLIEELARVPVEIDYASEFRYRNPILSPTTLMMAISQSGETADTLAALREAKEKGCRSLAICNVEGSMMTREADCTVYT